MLCFASLFILKQSGNKGRVFWGEKEGRLDFWEAVLVSASFKVGVQRVSMYQIANCHLELVFNSNVPLHDLFCPTMGRCGMHCVLGLNSPPLALSEVLFCFNIIIIRKCLIFSNILI